MWSLGVILVNLTCGRNPWKQASECDDTYRAFLQDPGFLKTILPITDELNDILKKIFERDPARRITIRQLRQELSSCPRLTKDSIDVAPASPPGSVFGYDSDDSNECFSPLSSTPSPPASSCYSPPDSRSSSPIGISSQEHRFLEPSIIGHAPDSVYTRTMYTPNTQCLLTPPASPQCLR